MYRVTAQTLSPLASLRNRSQVDANGGEKG